MWYPQTGTPKTLLDPGAAATAARTNLVDTQGGQAAEIVVVFGAAANTDNTGCAISISECDTSDGTFATFDSDLNTTINNDSAIVAVRHIPLIGRKRYLKLTLTPDTTANGATETAACAIVYKDVQTGSLTDQGDVYAATP